jgi:hypothetical protein
VAACRACGRPFPIEAPAALEGGRPVKRCAVCGDTNFFIQKDFNQKLGCAIVAVGAILVPWTYGLSLAVCAAIDALLYMWLPMVTVCYICSSRYRGIPLDPEHAKYDLVTAQTYEARSLYWRRHHDRSDEGLRDDGIH